MGKWERDPHDWYVDPPWCSKRLFEEERFEGLIVDPACGQGNILSAAQKAGLPAVGSDIVDRGARSYAIDFMSDVQWTLIEDLCGEVPNIVSNPPFGLCDERKVKGETFAQKCLRRATRKVALLMPATWHQADGRSRWLEGSGLRRIYHITPRPAMPPGTWLAAGNTAGNGTQDFAFYVWLRGYDGPVETRWLRRDP